MSKILEEKKNDLITRAEELVKVAETRELTEDEAQELAEIRDDVKKIKEAMGLEDEMREMLESEAEPKNDNVPTEEDKEMNQNACAEQEKRALETRALNERNAFENYLRGYALRDTETDLTKGDNGAVIPQTIADKIVRKVYDICPILEKSSQYNVKGTLTIPYYDDASPKDHITVAYADEFSALTSHVGQFTSQVTLTGFLAGALSKVSRSLINNSQFNIVDKVVDIMALDIARFIEHELLIGTPAVGQTPAKVLGLSSLTHGITASAQNAITADEVIKLHDSIKDVFQRNAIWIMSTATRTALRLLKDNMGRYLLQDDISSPFGSTILGKPVYVSDNMDEIGAGKTVIYYGDMKGLATKFNENISIQVLREKFADEHADGVIGWFEFDSKVENQQMISKLTMASA